MPEGCTLPYAQVYSHIAWPTTRSQPAGASSGNLRNVRRSDTGEAQAAPSTACLIGCTLSTLSGLIANGSGLYSAGAGTR
eukprot:1058160-Prymnesium_polylepis.3